MTRRFVISLAAGLLGFAFLVAADDPPAEQPEPPVRLKKKNKALPEVPKENPADDKAAEGKDRPPMPGERPRVEEPAPDAPIDGEAEQKEVLARVGRNMRTAEDRLANKEVGDGTRQVQRDILDDLDKLIKLSQQPPPPSGGGGASAKSGGQEQRGQQSARGGGKTSPRGQKPGQGQQTAGQKPGQGNQPQNSQANRGAGSNPGAGSGGPEEPNRIADLFKADVWGHLPETLRQEMNQYSREKFMAKYDDLIRQYYSTIAEKGRRKGN